MKNAVERRRRMSTGCWSQGFTMVMEGYIIRIQIKKNRIEVMDWGSLERCF